MKTTSESQAHLTAIQTLWRRHSDTLGFFPEGAFRDYSIRKQILVAVDENETLQGYLLFRVSGNQVVIVHLCTDEYCRGKGIARELVLALIDKSRIYNSIILKCRRDFQVSSLWPRLGFVAIGEVVGKSKEGHPLTVWKMDFGHPNLFSQETERRLKENFCVAIDANVFFGLLSNSDEEDEESKALISDWLPESFEIYVTEEIFNEINRNEDKQEREKQRAFAQRFSLLPSKYDSFEKVYSYLKSILPDKKTPSHESDIRQVCKSLCGGLKYFITRDEGILKIHEELFDRYNFSVLRPSDLISHLDELNNKAEYQPFRLAASNFNIRLIRSGEQESLAGYFQNSQDGEKKSDFLKILRAEINNPEESRCYLCFSDEPTPIAIFVYRKSNRGFLEIPVFRARKSSITPTVVRHLVYRAKLESSRRKCIATIFADPSMSLDIINILQEEYFHKTPIGYCKVNILESQGYSELLERIKGIHELNPFFQFIPQLVDLIESSRENGDIQNLLACEKQVWPAKFLDADVPCFLVPIKPYFAQQLFDEELALQDLLGATDLILNRELIYYRSSKPYVLDFPGRILWYVSYDKKFPYSGKVRAASYLDQIFVSKPKLLFKMFRRLGIYKWKDVFSAAHNDLDKQLMAVKFSETNLLRNPVSWAALQKILEKNNLKNNIQSPVKIPPSVYAEIYQSGFKGNHD